MIVFTNMLAVKQNVKTTLFCGPDHLSKTFMFEAAIHWAEEGRHVVYITPAPLESLPPASHDRSDPAPAAFKLMRFMYLANYPALVEKLVDLHNFAILPSVLLIDDFDNYLRDFLERESEKMHVARTCSLILDTMNSCSRILNTNVHVCAWSASSMVKTALHLMYFRNVWSVTEESNEITLKNIGSVSSERTLYKYHKFPDGTRTLKQILSISE